MKKVVKKVRGHITKVDPDCKVLNNKKKNKNLLRLDLACGNNKKDGFIGVDISEETQADYICDFNDYPWKWIKKQDFIKGEGKSELIPDNSVYEIHCSHYIEHAENIINFMDQIHRILIPGGQVIFYAPYYSSIRATQDPTHRNFISEATFLYYNKAWMKANKLEHYNINCDFNIVSTKFLYNKEWDTRSEMAKEYARHHMINVVSDIEVVLQANK